jgi:REP element-mobilizing transposase RayT
MARPLRVVYPGAVYHVTARGNERKAIVRDDADRRRFVATLGQMVEQYRVVCHAWVLMDNHYHLLLETPEANLSRAIRHLNGVYTQAFNRRYRRVGHLFQGRFKAILLEKDAHLLELCRYVVLNPVRARLVRHPRAWGWSSYRATAGEGSAPTWCAVDWVLGQFGRGREQARRAYRQFVGQGIKHTERPWEQVQGQIYLGGEKFLRTVQRYFRVGTDPEIPRRQRRRGAPRLGELLERVARAYGQRVTGLLKPTRRPSEARQVGMYLARRVAGLDLKAIGAQFGMSYAGVSRRVSVVAKRLREDASFRAKLVRLQSGK